MGLKCKVITTLDSTREVPKGFIKVIEDSTVTTEYEFEYEFYQTVYVVVKNWFGRWKVVEREVAAFAFTNIPSYYIQDLGFVLPDDVFPTEGEAKTECRKRNLKK